MQGFHKSFLETNEMTTLKYLLTKVVGGNEIATRGLLYFLF